MTHRAHAVLAAAVAASLLLPACSGRVPHDEEVIRDRAADFDRLTSSRDFSVRKSPFLGTRSLPLSDENAPALMQQVTMKSRGSFSDIVEVLRRIAPVTVTVAADPDDAAAEKPGNPAPAGRDEPSLDDLLSGGDILPAGTSAFSISYDGPLRGLLDQIAAQTGWGWDFDRAANTVTLARMMARTFTISATPGAVAVDTRITNSTKQAEAASVSLSGQVGSTVSSRAADSQTAQTSTNRLSYDTWKEILENVRILLSPKGRATGSLSAGTVTVHDRPENIRKVSRYIAGVNESYSRQVALRINVYSLETNRNSQAGIDVQTLFSRASGADVSVVAGALSLAAGSADTTSAAIVKGDLKGSSGVLKALGAWGKATQITSGGLVVRNNVPAPLQAIRKVGYLAGISSQTTDYGQTTTLTPGEVSTGFSMTILPHILDGRRVALSCSVTLSSLESLHEYTAGTAKVQLPQTASRAFSQSATLHMGQTLVLAGYQQTGQDSASSAGLFRFSRTGDESRTLLIITIGVENAAPELAGGQP